MRVMQCINPYGGTGSIWSMLLAAIASDTALLRVGFGKSACPSPLRRESHTKVCPLSLGRNTMSMMERLSCFCDFADIRNKMV